MKRPRCDFTNCKKRIVPVTGECKFCSFNYCIDHNMPELHHCSQFSQHIASLKEKNRETLINGKCVANKIQQI